MDVFGKLININFSKSDDVVYARDLSPDNKKVRNAIKSFANDVEISDVLLFIDTTITGSGKSGLLFTKEKIYTHKQGPLAYIDINFIKSLFGSFQINNMDFTLPMSMSDSKMFAKVLEELISELKKASHIDRGAISQSITDASNLNDEGQRKAWIADVLSSIDFKHRGKKVYVLPGENNNKVKNAIASFATGADANDVVLFIDTSTFKSGKKGIVFTTQKIYSHEFAPITYAELADAHRHMLSSLVLNGKKIKLRLIVNDVIKLETALKYIILRLKADKQQQEVENYSEFTKRSNKSLLNYVPFIGAAVSIVLFSFMVLSVGVSVGHSSAFKKATDIAGLVFGGAIWAAIFYVIYRINSKAGHRSGGVTNGFKKIFGNAKKPTQPPATKKPVTPNVPEAPEVPAPAQSRYCLVHKGSSWVATDDYYLLEDAIKATATHKHKDTVVKVYEDKGFGGYVGYFMNGSEVVGESF